MLQRPQNVSPARSKAVNMEMARSFPFHDDKHTPSGPGSRLWRSQSRGSGWTTSRAWSERGRPGHKHQAQGILYLAVLLDVGPVGSNNVGALGVSCSRLHGGGLLTQKICLPHISAASTFCICTYNKTESPWHISASQFTNKTIEKFTKPWLCPSSLYRLECRWTLRWPTFLSVPGPHMDA